MKKIVGMLTAFAVLFGLTACGSKYDFTCTGTIDGQEGTIQGIVKGGKVTEIHEETEMDAGSEETAKQYAAMYAGFGSMASESGMTMSAKASGTKVKVTIDVDVEKAKAAQDSDDEDSDFDLSDTSKEAMIKFFEKQGLKCK